MQKMPNDDAVFLHDRAPCMSALETQRLLTYKEWTFLETLCGQGTHLTWIQQKNWGPLWNRESRKIFFILANHQPPPGDKRSFSVVIDELSGRWEGVLMPFWAVVTVTPNIKIFGFLQYFHIFPYLIPIIKYVSAKNQKDDRFG